VGWRDSEEGALITRKRILAVTVALTVLSGLLMPPSLAVARPGKGHLRMPDAVSRLHPTSANAHAGQRQYRSLAPLRLPQRKPPYRANSPTSSPAAAPSRGILAVNVMLTVTKSGVGSGRVVSNPAGLDCGATCSMSVPSGTSVTLRAQPDGGSAWAGDGTGPCPPINFRECTIIVNANATVDFTFDSVVVSGSPQLSVVAGVTGPSDSVLECPTRPCLEPSDAGIAIGGSQALVSTNLGIEIRRLATSRQLAYGDLEWDIPLDDFFGVPASDVIVSDPHVLFDHQSGRFYATAISATCSTGRLYVAVSSTDDARDAWTIYRFDFPGELPDFDVPGFNDTTFAVSFNAFSWSGCVPSPFAGADLIAMDIDSLLAASDPLQAWEYGADSGLFTIIPAKDAGGFSSSPLRLVAGMINGAALDVGYAEVSGSVDADTINHTLSWQDLTQTAGIELDPFGDPPAPHQPGSPSTITDAVDLRPTEAFWNGNFWFASTTGCIPAGDTVLRACARFVQLGGSSGSLVAEGEILLGEAGADVFDPGINSTQLNAQPIVTYARSSTNSYVRVLAAFVSDPTGNHIGTPALLASGVGTYPGTRWGDFADMDGVGGWVGYLAQIPDAQGGWRTQVGVLAAPSQSPLDGSLLIDGGRTSTFHRQANLSAVPKDCCVPGSIGTRVLVSNSPTTSGGLLSQARELPDGQALTWMLDDPSTGGSTATGTRTVFLQWGDGSGTWSSVVQKSITLTPGQVQRVGGADRYVAAAGTSSMTFDPYVGTVFVTTGLNFPDALSASPVAGRLQIPILLVGSSGIPTATSNELKRLKPAQIVVLSGSGVISDSVLASLTAYGTVYRLAGATRYTNSALVSRTYFRPGVRVAYVASGETFPDALSGGAAAAKLGGPMLLVTKTSIPAAIATELTRLQPQRIVVLGGTGSVSDAVKNSLGTYTSGTVTRIGGADRYAVSAGVSASVFAPGVEEAYVATGANFPDALAGGAPAGIYGAPMLLVTSTAIPSAIKTELSRLKPKRIIILGGTGSVSAAVASALAAYATAP
jgi:putative cell wall-binding protein